MSPHDVRWSELFPTFEQDLDAVCAVGPADAPDQELDVATLLGQAARVASQLPAASEKSEVSFAFGNDRGACAAALLGTWLAGHTAALPVDAARDNVAPVLDREQNVAFLHDTGVGRGTFVPKLLSATPLPALPPLHTLPALLAERPLLATFAPGSDRPARTWNASELLTRLSRLAKELELSPRARVACTLAPTQEGALFAGMLAPLHSGARFETRAQRPPRTFVPGTTLVVGSRHHARVLHRSDAPFGLRTYEVDPASPADATGSCEAALLDHPGVEDAVVLALETPAPNGARVLAAIAGSGLERAGLDHAGLEDDDPELKLEGLKDLVTEHLPSENVAVRTLDVLPRTEDGRLQPELLFSKLGWGRNGRGVQRTLEWTTEKSDAEGTQRFRTQLPPAYAFFEGHFVTYPVLAGAVQLHELVLPCVRRVHGGAFEIAKLQNVKFMARIEPEDALEVLVRPAANGYTFEVLRADTRCSTGKLVLRSEEAE